MKITKQSMLSGVERTLDLPVTITQIKRWEQGELIQNVMPDLTDDQREFLKTGITAEEWEELGGDDEEG